MRPVIREGVVSIGGVEIGLGRFVGAVAEAERAVKAFNEAVRAALRQRLAYGTATFTVKLDTCSVKAWRHLLRGLGVVNADSRRPETRSQQRAAARRRAPWRRS